MHEVILSPGAEKDLARLHKADRKLFHQLVRAIEDVANDPQVGKRLQANLQGFNSYRVRDYRILYAIEEQASRIVVLKIQHRKDVYRDKSG